MAFKFRVGKAHILDLGADKPGHIRQLRDTPVDREMPVGLALVHVGQDVSPKAASR